MATIKPEISSLKKEYTVGKARTLNHEKHKAWENKERIGILRKFYEKSHSIRVKGDLSALQQQMLKELNETSGPKITISGASGKAKRLGLGSWGMSNEEMMAHDKALCEPILNDGSTSPEEKAQKLKDAMPWLNWRSILRRLELFGYSSPLPNGQPHRKRKSCWDNSDFLARISQMIEREHVLVEGAVSDGIKKILITMNEEFSSLVEDSEEPFNQTTLRAVISGLIWTNDRLSSLEITLINQRETRATIDKFQHYHPFIPSEYIAKEIRKLRGINRARFTEVSEVVGVNVVMTTEEFKDQKLVVLPPATREEPFIIPTKNDSCTHALMAGSLNFGSTYNPIIDKNTFRQFLEQAESNRAEFIILSGPIFNLEVKKANSSTRTHRARISGENFDENFVDPRYREKAVRIRDEESPSEVGYLILRERIESLLSGLRMVTLRPCGTPEYSGKIYITLGAKDEELIEDMASAMSSYITTHNGGLLRAEVAMAKKARDDAEGDQIEAAQKRYDAIYAEEKRTRVSNINRAAEQRYFSKVLSWYIDQLEKSIPNSKVLGLSSSMFIKIGKDIVNLTQWRKINSSDGVLDEIVLKDAGLQTLSNVRPPDVTIVCHPFPVNARWTVVENATDGNRGSGHVYVLPALLDKAFLSENLRDVIAKKTPLERMFRHEQFTPGYLDMRLSNGRWDINPVSIDTLKGRALRVRLAQKKKVPLKNSRYIYILIDTDPHWGNPWKVYFWNETSGNWLGTTPALIELLRRDGMLSDSAMPIHGFFLLDDGVHGNHFGTQKQPHQDHLPFWMIESWFQNILERAEQSRKPKVAMDALRESRLFALEQIKARGEHRLQNQLREYKHRMLAPNLDFFVALLRQVHTAGIKFRGISHYLGKSFDSRDLGAISFGDGNHNQKTIDYELSEGFQYCEWLIARLLSMEECGAFSSQLEQLIKSPIYGSIHIGLGTVQGGEKGCEWALSLRSNPTAKSGMGDPLRNAAKKLIARGNFARFFQGKPIIDLSGDVHRFGRVEIPGAPGKGRTVINCASGTDTDSFGEIIGFSPNNCGNIIVGIPVDGPENGEVRVIPFTFDWLEEQFDNPQPINWNLILRDPA